jgi:hypothetical protein
MDSTEPPFSGWWSMIWNALAFGVNTSSISWSRGGSLLISGLHRDGFVHPVVLAFTVYNHRVDYMSAEVVAYGVVSTGTDALTISA